MSDDYGWSGAPPPITRRASGLKAISAALPQASRSALAKRGLASGRLLADWAMIVGPVLAEASIPQRLARPPGQTSSHVAGVLTIKVRPGAAIEFQHWEPLIVERINAHFGYRAVERLRLVQGMIPRARRREPPPPPKVDEAALAARLEGVDDPELRESLARLGRRVARP